MAGVELPAQYRAAADLEAALGDPTAPERPFSFAHALALDEAEAFPDEACAQLEAAKMHHYYVPSAVGGRLHSFEELLLLYRLVARRDLTVAIGHGKTLLGAMAVWVAGDARQKAEVARLVLDGAQLALALTERAHGSDLVASEVVARRHGDTLRLNGEKWLINNATRGRALSVLAQLEADDGTRQLSMLFVDKERAAPGAIVCLPKNRTHGIRGADISGVRFCDAALPVDAVVGGHGRGLEVALSLLQVTRTSCSALSLGAGDTALRLTADFAAARRLYGTTVDRLPHARELLVGAYVQQLVCECVSIAAARTLHVAPAQMSVASAVAKSFVPTTIEASVASLSTVLGARWYLRGEGRDGAFEKLVRDNALIGLFDGSKVVNLAALGSQLARLADARARSRGRVAPGEEAALTALFDLRRPTPALAFDRLALTNGDDDLVVQALARAPSRLAAAAVAGDIGGALRGAVDVLAAELARFDAAVLEAADAPAYRRSPLVFEHARQYCCFWAASACLHHWLFNRAWLPAPVAGGGWLALALSELVRAVRPGRNPQPAPAWVEATAELFAWQHRHHALFSTLPVPIAWSAPPEAA